VVTNHVANAVGNRVFVVDPVSRTLRGGNVANRLASIRPNQSTGNGQRVSQPRSTFGPSRVSQGRVFSPPAVRGRSFSPVPSRIFSAHATGGRGSFGGFRGGGRFSEHGGSFGGGARGHR
jgi:hypothetical protein